MSARLVILGFLRDRPLHGYEIKQKIQEHMGDWTSIAFGSIYFALGKLEEEGFISKAAIEQHGHRPSRSIYEITEVGQNEFLRLLRQVWSQPERQYFALDLGLFYMEALPREEIKDYLSRRLAWLQVGGEHLAGHRAESLADEQVPRLAAAIFDHTLAHLQAELAWTREVLEKVEAGEYP